MERALERKLLLSELRAYLQILEERGLSGPLSMEEADKLEETDLRRLVRETRDIARTPPVR